MQFFSRAAVFGLALLAPYAALACACGCGIFDVGAGTMAPTDSDTGLSVWFQYDYMNQSQNLENASKASASDNQDKELVSNFYTVGGEYMISRDWTVMAELPIVDRRLTTTDDGTVFGPAGTVYTGQMTDLGDLQVSGLYTGFSPDLSTGAMFGMKLPTGNYTGPNGLLGGPEFDRDTLPGTGSTDLMFGGYHTGSLSPDGSLGYFVQARYQFAVVTRDGYRPGNEFDGATGLTYDFGQIGPLTQLAPVMQLLGSYREHDSGPEADPLNTGYGRLLVAPGVQIRIDKLRLFADIELPIYQSVNAASNVAIDGTSGQLVASALYKVRLAYDF